jgi:hypothetical protein
LDKYLGLYFIIIVIIIIRTIIIFLSLSQIYHVRDTQLHEGQGFFAAPQNADRLWDTRDIYSGAKLPVHEPDRSPISSVEVKNVWNCNFTSHCLNCMVHNNIQLLTVAARSKT